MHVNDPLVDALNEVQRMRKFSHVILVVLMTGQQLAENPLTRAIGKTPPAPSPIGDTFEVRDGSTVILEA